MAVFCMSLAHATDEKYSLDTYIYTLFNNPYTPTLAESKHARFYYRLTAKLQLFESGTLSSSIGKKVKLYLPITVLSY